MRGPDHRTECLKGWVSCEERVPANHPLRPRRHLMSAAAYREARAQAFAMWREETRAQQAT